MFCFKTRKAKETPITGLHKWAIYVTGLLETLIFGSSIFGWAQVVYVLKNEEIFWDLCENNNANLTGSGNVSDVFEDEKNMKLQGCSEQEEAFALIYALACAAFGAIGFLTAYSLLYFGLVVTRIISTTSLIIGFLALGLTTKEKPYWLYISVVLIGYGGNMLRLCGLQFCNLFTSRKSTALSVISGSFVLSQGVFTLFQVGQSHGLSLWTMSFFMAFLAFLSSLATAFMPWQRVPLDEEERRFEGRVSFKESILSVSFFLFTFVYSMIMMEVRFYLMYYNSWTTSISVTNDEVGLYSYIFSISFIICPVFIPLPGMVNDFLLKKAKLANPGKRSRFEDELKIPLVTTSALVLVAIVFPGLLLMQHYIAVYISLPLLQAVRTSILPVSAGFLRIRFPPEHFDRLIGINTTILILSVPLQYLIFVWSLNNIIRAISFMFVMLVLSLSFPLHLMSKKYRKKIAEERFPDFEDQEKSEDIKLEQDKGDQDSQERDQEEHEILNI